ncbi:MAG TPA: GatB/YqeY domain-containing protein [Parvibaculum sp.]|mgnify:FL=1|uniref:GatB/YqeY domain-containing protein n=1 Tax=Parvibaculum sp. TaxID=2024848 RepID=UPI002C1A84DC|nr:GatB/YqeY domain-containing protein [Parvibaculum sp.]HMM15836.1 GatB/YqeY domain-containing protein [Parvibaculum sp.]
MSQSLRESIMQQVKDAMKAGDKARLSALRLMQAAIKDRDIASRTDGRNEGVSDADLVDLFSKMVKQRRESADLYEKGGRPELADQERAEIAVIESFMPKQLSDDEARAAIEAVVKELGATTIKDMGRVMGELKKRHAGQMDFARAGAAIKALLG